MKRVLFTPGPTEVPSEVLEAMAKPLIHQRTDEYRQYLLETTRLMQEHLGTKEPAITLSCSGSGAMEAAAVNLISPGDEAIVVEGGKFGDRWRAICAAYGATVHTVSVEWGRVATVEEVESALTAHPKAKVMFLTHSETSTGALFPVHDMARAAKARGVAAVVDAITSYGVYDLHFDRSDLEGIVWHFIGQVQSNKAARIASYADVVHSVSNSMCTPSIVALMRGTMWMPLFA
jgi:aspartate aminotransferase-like enzyme